MTIRTSATPAFKGLLALAMCYMMIYLVSDAVAFKMISYHYFNIPGPPLVFPITYAISDIITEVYGLPITKKIIWTTLILEQIAALLIYAIIQLPSPLHDQAHFNYVYGHIIRFVVSGFFAVALSSFLNIYIVSKWKIVMHGKYFWFRSLISSLVGGFVLVATIVIFGYGAFTKPIIQTIDFFISIYSFESIYSIVLVIPTSFACYLLKRYENLHTFESKVRFNPFNFN